MDTLLEAAAQVFTREGLAATTNRIAERAGMSIGTLYQYFPNKQALLHMLAARHLAEGGARLSAVLTELRSTHPPFEETMRRVLETVLELHSDRPALHAVLHRVAPQGKAEWEAFQAFEDYLVSEIAYHLERCERGGQDPLAIARTVVHTVDVHVHRVLPRHGLTTEQLMSLVEQLAPKSSR